MEHAGASPEEGAAQLAKLTVAYNKFLSDSVGQYRRLVARLQYVFGYMGARVEVRTKINFKRSFCSSCFNTTGARKRGVESNNRW